MQDGIAIAAHAIQASVAEIANTHCDLVTEILIPIADKKLNEKEVVPDWVMDHMSIDDHIVAALEAVKSAGTRTVLTPIQ